MKAQIEKVLVILPNYIGDVLMTTPAIRLIKKIIPTAKITALVSRRAYDVIKDNPNIEKIIIRKDKLNLFDRLKLIKDISSKKFGFAILFRDTIFNRLLTFFVGAKKVMGVNNTTAKSYKEICWYAVENAFGCKVDEKNYDMDIYISESDEFAVKKFLSENNCGKFVTINPVSTRLAKMWNIANYPNLVDKVFLKYGLKTVIIGSEKDFCVCKTIYDVCQCKPIIASGRLSLAKTAELIRKSEIFISPDTGPLHISIAVNKKTVGLFGSTNPEKYGPYPEYVKTVYHKLSCSPCYKNVCPLTENKNLCMEQITVDEVLNQIDELIVA